jgi:hypothetical protein
VQAELFLGAIVETCLGQKEVCGRKSQSVATKMAICRHKTKRPSFVMIPFHKHFPNLKSQTNEHVDENTSNEVNEHEQDTSKRKTTLNKNEQRRVTQTRSGKDNYNSIDSITEKAKPESSAQYEITTESLNTMKQQIKRNR